MLLCWPLYLAGVWIRSLWVVWEVWEVWHDVTLVTLSTALRVAFFIHQPGTQANRGVYSIIYNIYLISCCISSLWHHVTSTCHIWYFDTSDSDVSLTILGRHMTSPTSFRSDKVTSHSRQLWLPVTWCHTCHAFHTSHSGLMHTPGRSRGQQRST